MSYRGSILAVAAILAGVSAATARDTLRVGVTPSIATAVAYVAEHEGIFDKHDLDVEFIVGNGAVLVAGRRVAVDGRRAADDHHLPAGRRCRTAAIGDSRWQHQRAHRIAH